MFKFVVLLSFAACVLGAAIPTGLLPQLDGRVAGGSATTIAKYPYVVSLQRSGSHSCGGSIYSSTVIVTAAHCLQNVDAGALKIRAGSSDRKSGGTLVGVSSFTTNPNYNANTKEYDVAVIKLESALTFGANIAKIDLVSTAPSAGTAASVCGWGTVSAGGSTFASTLQVVDMTIVSETECASDTYLYGSAIKDAMICAIGNSADSCYGDEGGPLVVAAGQAGIVSWGYGCALTKYPSVYTDIASVRTWIVDNA